MPKFLMRMVAVSVILVCGISHGAESVKKVPSQNYVVMGTREKPSVIYFEQCRIVRQAVDTAEAAYLEVASKEGISNDQREELWRAYVRTNDPALPKILQTVRQEPTSATAFELLEWTVLNRRIHARTLMGYGLEAVELLRDNHAANPKVGRICGAIAKNWDWGHPPTLEFLKAVGTRNPDRTARANAIFALACLTRNKAGSLGKDEAKTAFNEAEQLFDTIVRNYADCPDLRPSGGKKDRKIGDAAERELYELRYLRIGRVAPEIAGEDLDGRKFKLSDYRGNIVVLSFWATWCGPCMQLVPQERTLVERMHGKPFVLLGVNGDKDRAKLKPVIEKEKITWRSFWNGGPDGPVSTVLNVHSWPSVFVLDGNGVIRFKDVIGEALDAAVDQLLKEMEEKKAAAVRP